MNRRRTHRRVSTRGRRVRHYVNGEPNALGRLGRDGVVTWLALYDVPEYFSISEETGKVVSHGYAY